MHNQINNRFNLLPSRWPFNDKSPLGFWCVSFFLGVENFFVLITGYSALCFLLGSCWLFVSIGEDIIKHLSVLNRRKNLQLKQHLCDIVKMYSDVKELSIGILMMSPETSIDQQQITITFYHFIVDSSMNLMTSMNLSFLAPFCGRCSVSVAFCSFLSTHWLSVKIILLNLLKIFFNFFNVSSLLRTMWIQVYK